MQLSDYHNYQWLTLSLLLSSWKIAALLDGSTIDFLFNVRNNINNKSKAVLVKTYIREQDPNQQVIIANFYYKLYHAIASYYEEMKRNNLLTCFGSCFYLVSGLRSKLFDNINEAYKPVYASIYSIKC